MMRIVLWIKMAMRALQLNQMMKKAIPPSPMKTRTRSKSRKVIVPETLLVSDTEDEIPRPQQRKRNDAAIVPVQLRCKQVDMPNISDATRINSRASLARSLQPAWDRLADEDESVQFKTARQTTTCS